MSKLTEKLGIKPIEEVELWVKKGRWCAASKVRKVEQQNADMLEALIEDTMSVEEVFVDMPNLPFKAEHREKHKSRIRLIEKVADMPWQRVKEKNS